LEKHFYFLNLQKSKIKNLNYDDEKFIKNFSSHLKEIIWQRKRERLLRRLTKKWPRKGSQPRRESQQKRERDKLSF